ncbi:MAG: N-acetyltransferase family protein [Deltaproteobacteria bacterium]|nr:MAG: N-acetyltransferase family protein [Deltaproteobacteria bacterium]
MNGAATIRSATAADAAAIAELYNWYIAHTTITFEVDPVSPDEMARRIAAVLAAHDWLVLERAGELLGYAYATRFHARAAYGHTTESTIYLRHGLEGKGFGGPLYAELVRSTFARGYRHMVGAIALPNEPSVRLHERLGFVKAGHLFRIGRKFDRWIDVGNWQLENASD